MKQLYSKKYLLKKKFKKNPVINHNGKEYEKEYIYIWITESLCCTAEIKHNIVINYTSIKKTNKQTNKNPSPDLNQSCHMQPLAQG